MQMQSKVHGKLVKTDSQVVLLQALPRTHGQAISCSCLYYYRLWYSFLSSLSHYEHVYLLSMTSGIHVYYFRLVVIIPMFCE